MKMKMPSYVFSFSFVFELMSKNARNYGVLAGVVTIALMLLVYQFDKATMLSRLVYWPSLIIYIAFMYKACLEERKSHGGFLTFQDGLRTAFGTFLIANLIFYVFYYVMFNYVDPGLVSIQAETFRAYADAMEPGQAKDMMKAIEKQGFEVTLSSAMLGFAKGAIGGFLLSLIIGGLTKRI